MKQTRNKHSPAFKAKVALANPCGGSRPISPAGQTDSRGTHRPTSDSRSVKQEPWWKEPRSYLPPIRNPRRKPSEAQINAPRTRHIGTAEAVERDCLCRERSEVSSSRSIRRAMIDRDHQQLSLVRQCILLDVSRASVYYRPVPTRAEDLELMALLWTVSI